LRQLIPLLALALVGCSAPTKAASPRERDYQRSFCANLGGQAEVVLEDRTRVDCLTADYAIEVDFAPKWAESVGQALYYAERTGRAPGVLLILRRPGDVRHLDRLQTLGARHGITIWTTYGHPQTPN
jgi:hypothetical protein